MNDLPPPEAKAAAVEEMFDRLAPRYERMNRLLTFGMDVRWRQELVDMAGVEAGQDVLDLACGTGDLARLATSRGAKAVGLDFSAVMVEQARRAGLAGGYVRGDALALPFPERTFDAVVSGFAIRNFTDLARVFAECARVTRPGGRIAILEIDEPRSALVRAGHGLYFGRVVPVVGGMLSGDRAAYRYLAASGVYLPSAAGFGQLLHEAGYRRVRKRSRMSGAIQMIVGERK